MSAFVCIFHRDGTPVDPTTLERLAAPLATPFPSSRPPVSTWLRGPVALAARPGMDDGDPLDLASRVDRFGRLAVRIGPRAATAGGAAAGSGPGDGGGGDAVTDHGGSGTGIHLLVEPEERRVEIRAAALGSLPVYYHLDPGRLIAATDPAALLRHPAVPADLDDGSVARFLGFRTGDPGASFFRAVRMLPPGQRLRVDAQRENLDTAWRLRRLPGLADRPAEEIVEDFLSRLTLAVEEDVAAPGPHRVALSLGGGLDSTALAALVPPGVRAFSWTFRETPDALEDRRVEAVARHLGLPLTRVPGDGLQPLGEGFAERFVLPGSPFVNPFAALKARLYEVAREAGCHRVMVGDGGDALYAARELWLRDLLRDWLRDGRSGGTGSLVDSVVATLGRAGRGDPFARRSLLRLLPTAGLRRRLRRPPAWLTAQARAALPAGTFSPILPAAARPPWRYELAAGLRNSELEAEDRRLFHLCGVERSNPFWTPRVLELAIQLPAYWYHRDGRHKVLTRLALRDRLPAGVLEGGRSGLLGSFFLRGLERHRERVAEMVFRHPRSDWPSRVRRDWIEPHLWNTRTLTFGHTILWRVIGYELWCRRLGA